MINGVNSKIDPTSPAQPSGWPLSSDPQRRYQLIKEITSDLLAVPDTNQMLSRIVQHLVPDFADWCIVNIVTADGGMKRLSEARAMPEAKSAIIDEIRRLFPPVRHATIGLASVIDSGKAELAQGFSSQQFASISTDAEYLRLWTSLGIVSYMGIPLKARGKVIGALGIESLTPGRHYSPHDLAFAEEIGQLMSLALDRGQLYAEAMHSARLKDEFLATLSHELRTPLSVILGWTQLLLEQSANGTLGQGINLAHALSTIERNTKLQISLVENILDMSRISLDKINFSLGPINLAKLIGLSVESMRPTADAKTLRLTYEDAGPALIAGDSDRLQQIFSNLIGNAIKFTPAGGHVHVALGRQDQQVVVTVQDSGIGIEPEFLPFVFERFRQADSSLTRVYGGLGLGMALVRALVERHGGSIEVVSPGANKGTIFTVRFPQGFIGALPSTQAVH